LLLDLIAVALGRSVTINELTTTTDADVILLTPSLAVLTDMSGLTFWTFHQNLPPIHPSIMQRQKIFTRCSVGFVGMVFKLNVFPNQTLALPNPALPYLINSTT
jgi:hypothetical protein